MTERELQIQKIHQLLESNDEDLVKLASQLIRSHFSFGEIFNQYFPITEMEYDLKFNYQGQLINHINHKKALLSYLDDLINSKSLSEKFNRKCSIVCSELLSKPFYQDYEANLVIFFGKKCKATIEWFLDKEYLLDYLKIIHLANPLERQYLMPLYWEIDKKGNRNKGFMLTPKQRTQMAFVDIRRKSRNPLEYEVQPYDEEYVILKLAVTLDYQ